MAIPHQIPSSSSPTVDQFAHVLSRVPSWYNLGVFLGISTTELDTISFEYSRAPEGTLRCLIEVYKSMEREGKSLSWKSIAEALRLMGNHSLADEIHSQYIKPRSTVQQHSTSTNQVTHSPSPLSIVTYTPATQHDGSSMTEAVVAVNTSVPVIHNDPLPPTPQAQVEPMIESQSSNEPHLIIDSKEHKPVCLIANEYETLSTEFKSIAMKVKQAIKKQNVDLDEMQDVVRWQCDSSPLPQEIATVNAAFTKIVESCSILNFKAITFIATTLLKDGKIFVKQLSTLEKSVKKFKSSANMVELVTLIKSKHTTPTQGQKAVVLKLREHWRKPTYAQFEIMINELFQDLHDKMTHITVTKGCICVNWIIPDIDTTELVPVLPLEFIRLIGVIYLHIGSKTIYNIEGDGCESIEAAMLQAIELKNTRAIELLLAVGCSPQVATYTDSNTVTNIVNIRAIESEEGSSGSSGGVDQVCILGHNKHVEAIIDPRITQAQRQSDNDCKQIITIIHKVFKKNRTNLGGTVNVCIKDFANKLYEKDLITKPTRDSENFDKIMNELDSVWPYVGDIPSLQVKFNDFFSVLEDLGGPPAMAGKSIFDVVKNEVNQVLPDVHFLQIKCDQSASTPGNVVSIKPKLNRSASMLDTQLSFKDSSVFADEMKVTHEESSKMEYGGIYFNLKEENGTDVNNSQELTLSSSSFSVATRPTTLTALPSLSDIQWQHLTTTPKYCSTDSGIAEMTSTDHGTISKSPYVVPSQPVSDYNHSKLSVLPPNHNYQLDSQRISNPSEALMASESTTLMREDVNYEKSQQKTKADKKLLKLVEADVRYFKKEAEKLSKENQELNNELKEERKERESLERKLSIQDATISSFRDEKIELNKRKMLINQEKQDFVRQQKKLERKHTKKQKDLEEKQREIKKQEEQLMKMKSAFEKEQAQQDKLRQKKNENAKRQIKQKKKSLDQKKIYIKRIKDELSKQKESFDEQENLIQQEMEQLQSFYEKDQSLIKLKEKQIQTYRHFLYATGCFLLILFFSLLFLF